jgi:uncharacterized protein involved in exopolysaccharide biosynthesis
MDNSGLQTSTREIVFVLFKRKWSLITVVLAGVIGAAVWLWGIREDGYTATGKVLVKLGQEQVPPSTVLGGTPLVMEYRTQEVNTEVEILQNTQLLARVVDEMGLDKPALPPPPPSGLVPRVRFRIKSYVRWIEDWKDETLIRMGLRERLTLRENAINILKGGLQVKAEKDSNVFTVEMTLPVRHAASTVLNLLLAHYLEFRQSLYEDKGVEFFQNWVARTSADLNKTDQRLQEFESAGNISLLQEQQAELVKQIAQGEALLKDAELALNDAAYRVSRMEQELKKDDPNFGALGDFERDSFPNNILRQLAQLQQEREALRMTQLDTEERIQNNRNQFKVLVDMLAANLRSVAAVRKDDYDLRNSTLQGLQAGLNALHNKQMVWVALRRNSGGHEEALQFYRRKLEEASAGAALERQRFGNVSVIQPATDATQPSGMRKTTLFGLTALVSIFAAIVWICLLELFDHRIYTMEDLESHLGVPVFAVVPSGRASRISDIRSQEGNVAHT